MHPWDDEKDVFDGLLWIPDGRAALLWRVVSANLVHIKGKHTCLHLLKPCPEPSIPFETGEIQHLLSGSLHNCKSGSSGLSTPKTFWKRDTLKSALQSAAARTS